jgi:diguanylate cyclase (GGDEF)-like protein
MRVLVADDDAGIRLVARTVVEGLGHECLEAANGREAWAMFSEHQPQVLVADRMMPPGRDGLQLCRAVRDSEQNSYTYIVMLTSLATRDEILAGIDAGADDYVIKPLDPFVLHSRLLVAQRVTSLHLELGRFRSQLAKQAQTDPLTGLNNRLKLSEDLDRLHHRSVRYGRTYSLALCDIDFFKKYNDTYGHQSGDRALQTVAAAITGSGRQGDSIYRYGGEEFLLVLPEQTAITAAAALERCRTTVQRLEITHVTSPAGVLTISVGISTFVPGSETGSERLLGEADTALYEAKATGRNRVTVASLSTAADCA